MVVVGGFVVLLVLASYLLFGFVKEYAGSPSGTVSASAPSSVDAGSSVTVSATASDLSYSGDGYFCLSSSHRQPSASWCNGGGGNGCLEPCTWKGAFDGMVSQGYWYQTMVCMDSDRCNFASFDGATDMATVYAACENGVWYLLGNSGSSPSSFNGFYLADGQSVDVYVYFDTSILPRDAPAVGLCAEGSGYGYSGPDHYSSNWQFLKYWYPSFMGHSWHCTVWKYVGSSNDPSAHLRITGSGSARFAIFMSGARTFDSSQCSNYWSVGITRIKIVPDSSQLGSTVRLSFIPQTSGIDCDTSSAGTSKSVVSGPSTGSSFSTSVTCSVSSTASSPGRVKVEWDDLGPMYFHAGSDTFYVMIVPEMEVDSDTVSFTVVRPATDVSLSSVRQEPDDSAVEGTITVSGGTKFDYVKVYIDGSSVATVNRSSFSCGSSSCTYHFNYSMYGKSDGSHTVKVDLYVDGSKRDSDTASFSYYQVGIRNVSASQTSASFEAKGGYKYVRVYVDSSSCVAKDWTNIAPSSSHSWQAKSVSYSWPSCAAGEGTHTVYVQLKDESGHVVSDSTTVTVSFDYSLSNPQPAQGTRYYVQAPTKWSVPESFSIPTSVDYYTSAPSATLKEYFAGQQVAQQSVSGSGTFEYTVTGSQIGSGCGTGRTISWELGSAGEQTSVDIYCIYADIVSPTGSITLPTADGSTVTDGATVTVEVEAVSNPSGVSLEPYVTLDGETGVAVNCSDPSHTCYRFDASGWSCGSTHTVDLSVSADGNPDVATDSATFTVNCAQNYVEVASPEDGSTVNIYEPVQDVQLTLAVNWASDDPGAYLKVWLNGAYRDLATVSDCSATTCYAMKYSDGLQLGANDVRVELYDSSDHKVVEDSSSFHVNYWSFVFGEDWDSTPAVVYVKDSGEPDHADYCQYDLNGETGNMNFNPSLIRWELPVTEDDVDKNISVRCYYGSEQVFEGTYRIQGSSTEQPATPVINIGGGSYSVSAFPIFPKYDRVGRYIFSVYTHKGVAASSVFKDVYISNGQLCFVPKKGSHRITYYKASFRVFPTSENEVDQIIGSLQTNDIITVPVSQKGSAYCFPVKGTAMVLDSVDDGRTGEYYFVVLDTQESTMDMNLVFVGVIAALLIGYILYQKGAISLG